MQRSMSARSSSRMSTKSGSKRSVLKAGSGRSGRASSTRSLNKKLQAIEEAEENQPINIVQGIMNELMENVMDKIFQVYIEKQAVNFVVHCAHQAFIKVITMHFYLHNDYRWDEDNWGAGKTPAPSPPDSWAVNQVLPFKKDRSERALNTISQIKMRAREQGGDVNHVFSDVDIEVVRRVHSETLVADMEDIINRIIDELPLPIEEEEESVSDMKREPSHFTQVSKGVAHFAEFRMSPQASRIKIGASVVMKLPRIHLPESDDSRRTLSCSQIGKLPPIRINANYKCRATTQKEENDDPKKKKKPK